MDMEQIIEQGEKYLLHTYNRYPVVLEKGEGVRLYDKNGKEYLDFCAGIAVFALGYHYKGLDEAIISQVKKIIHTSNYFYNEPAVEAAGKLCAATGLDRVFFTNSGTEAIEGAIKTVLRYAYDRDGEGGHEIIAMENSFHGRSIGALSVTMNDHYQEPFRPLLSGIRKARFNDLESVRSQINKKTCAIIMETIQGEGGIYPADADFIMGVRELCDQNGILLVLDEIQCGMGRTGKMFAYEHYNVRPDVLTVAKALGCGLPVGAFVCSQKAAALKAGDHGSTYGGNPLVCAAAGKILDIFKNDRILENVTTVGKYLEERLDSLKKTHPCIKDSRGAGLMRGLEFSLPVADIIKAAQEEGLILINAGSNIIRLVPPLIISEQDVDEMIKIIESVLKNMGL